MDVLGFLIAVPALIVSKVIPFLFVLTVVVFFHELGHCLVARWCGVTVKVFSVGFGPELIGRTDRKGTRWKISTIPLGGYVKFLGDDSEASTPDRDVLAALTPEERRGAFAAKTVGQRAAIVAAGPIANFVLAILIFATIFATFGRQVTEPRADEITPGSAAEEAGILPGDLIRSIDGSEIDSFTQLHRIVSVSAGDTLTITLERNGQVLTVQATPRLHEDTDRFGNPVRRGMLGITRNAEETDIRRETYSVPAALWMGVKESWFVVDQTMTYLGGVIMGRESADQLGGPLRVAQVSAQAASVGFATLINLAAILSVSIGLINLFPIPILDGGHLLFYAAEAVRGRPLSDRTQDIGFRIGLAAVIMLMIFATWNDIPFVFGSFGRS